MYPVIRRSFMLEKYRYILALNVRYCEARNPKSKGAIFTMSAEEYQMAIQEVIYKR